MFGGPSPRKRDYLTERPKGKGRTVGHHGSPGVAVKDKLYKRNQGLLHEKTRWTRVG